MNITEPTTMLTDYALAGLGTWLGRKLFLLSASRRQKSIKLWAGAFISTALAALVGGTSHGFALMLSSGITGALWKLTLYLTGFSSFFLLSAVILACLPHPLNRWGLALSTVKLLVYLAWMFNHDDFRFVVYDYGSAMVLILMVQVRSLYKSRSQSAAWIVGGILVSFLAAAIQQSGFSLHQHFNHND
ncbi:hypothetical protein MYX75_12355, partial [Acidobacteria bacterium AH-259-A15]|nr:hypothetical protein [Acidobacteria bacterium AH-259-A15]